MPPPPKFVPPHSRQIAKLVKLQNLSTMTTPSVSCAVVAIFGIEDSRFGCSCENHPICGFNVDYDTLLRFKTVVISSGKSLKKQTNARLFQIPTNAYVSLIGRNKSSSILAAVWITDGMDRCIVGFVDPRALGVRERLEGRLGQVTELFSLSASSNKKRYSTAHKGVCLAALIDSYLPGDELINSYLDPVESESEEEAVEG